MDGSDRIRSRQTRLDFAVGEHYTSATRNLKRLFEVRMWRERPLQNYSVLIVTRQTPFSPARPCRAVILADDIERKQSPRRDAGFEPAASRTPRRPPLHQARAVGLRGDGAESRAAAVLFAAKHRVIHQIESLEAELQEALLAQAENSCASSRRNR